MMSFKQYLKAFEAYQEEEGGSFTHDGKEYDLNKLFELTQDFPLAYFFVGDLKWILDEDDQERTLDADLNAPILVTQWQDKWVVLDGVHRLAKAISIQQSHLPGRFVTMDQLQTVAL
jgi:hypothetical protein